MASSPFAQAPGKPPCKYGLSCYRQNPQHWRDYDHPADHALLVAAASSNKRAAAEDGNDAGQKRQRAEPSSATRAVLVFAPGAGGKTANAMRSLHEEELRARSIHVLRCDDEPLAE